MRSTKPALKTVTPSFVGLLMVNFSTRPGASLASLTRAVSSAPWVPSKTSLIGSVRLFGNSSSNCSWASRVGLSGGRYVSLMPPNLIPEIGIVSSNSPITIGIAHLSGCFITHCVNRPQ